MSTTAASPPGLGDDAWIMLDPAVEILGVEVAGCSLLCQTDLELGMVVPEGEGLLDFVRALMGQPVRVAALRAEYDDRALVDEMLASLLWHGFAHVTPPQAPSDEELARLRGSAERALAGTLRRVVAIDLDAAASLDDVRAAWSAGQPAPEVLLRCARLSDHGAALGELARLRQAGRLRAHHVVARAADVQCDEPTRASLVRLGAAVEIEGVPWPAPAGSIPGLAEHVRSRVATHVRMRPDASLLDEGARARCSEWIGRERVSGLGLWLDAGAIWGSTAATDEQHLEVFRAVRALELELGDVVVTNMPSDEVLLGHRERGPLRKTETDAARRIRLAYVRWRVPLVKGFESTNPWAQIPELEDKWVRGAEDLLPNHPELLRLEPGSAIVDVCGGLGRVARRLAPAIGREGLIVSIEMRRFLTERARCFAYERDMTNLQFRPGLAQRLPLADASVDAAVNEWTGAIWELGLGPAMVSEMARVVRPGGRIAVTHRLVQLRLGALARPRVQYEQIYSWVRQAFRHPELTIVAERVWGQTVPSPAGEREVDWAEQFMPRLVNPIPGTFPHEDTDEGASRADVYLTLIAERRA
jgi:SAM-dependent methyltransferase